jgi:hypothetical protein
MSWLKQNAEAVEAGAAVVTALVAVLALAGVVYQVAASDTQARAQSAREIYREFVALSVNKPALAAPDYCTIADTPQTHTAYRFYVEYLLYTAEQVLSNDESWAPVFAGHLSHHEQFFCGNPEWSGDIAAVATLIAQTKQSCASLPPCS